MFNAKRYFEPRVKEKEKELIIFKNVRDPYIRNKRITEKELKEYAP